MLLIHTLNFWTDRVVSGACFLTRGGLHCDLAHRRSVAVLCMLYKIRCNLMHALYGTLPMPYVPVRVTSGALVAHRYNAPPRCRTLQYCRTFVPFAVSLWNDLDDPVFDSVGLAGFKRRPMRFCWPSCSLLFVSSTVFPFSSFLLSVGIVELGSLD